MTIRLTTPEAFDRLIDFLEKERDLVFPDMFRGFKKTYRDYFIELVKEQMAIDTVFLHIDWKYNAQTNRVEASAYYSGYSEVQTDEEYLSEETKIERDGK